MNFDYLRSELQRALMEQSFLEGAATAMAKRLSISLLLTPVERDFAGDRLRPEESAHMKWTRYAAASLGQIDYRPLRDVLMSEFQTPLKRRLAEPNERAEEVDREFVTRFNYDERFFLHAIRPYRTVIHRLLPPELTPGAVQLEVEERGHQEWGSMVLRRLRAEHPEWTSEMKRHQTIRSNPVRSVALRFANLHAALSRI